MKKWILVGTAVVLIAASGTLYWYTRDGQTEAAATVQPTARVTKGNISVKISGSGSVNTVETVSVSAGAQGKVSKVNFKAGDKVKKGQLLIAFEQEDYTNQIAKAELNLKKQDLQLASLKKQYIEAYGDEDRQADIKLQIDSLRLDIESANLELADLKEQEAAIPSVVAPSDGTVTTASVAVGDQLNESKVIAEIVDYSKLQFTMNVDELDIPKIKVGQAADIVLNALPTEALTGKVLSIAQEGSSSNGSASYAVTVSLDKLTGVIAGMSGEASVITASSDNTLLVPIAAVRTVGGRSIVRVPESSTAGTGTTTTGTGARTQTQGQAQQPGTGATETGQAARGAAGEAGAGGGANGGAPSGNANGNGGTGAGAGTGTPNGQAGGQQGFGGQGGRTGQAGAYGGYGGQRQAGQFGGQRGAGGAGAGNAAQQAGRMVEVTIGLSNETYVEIKSGLTEGETVYLPMPTVSTATASSSQQQQMNFGQFGGFGGAQFGGGGFTGGGGGGGARFSAGGGGGSR
ncbi:efflux transporter, RND family, MFP subunit [Paenibacillus curdlanolyticus YK9]|uniref:Efflux transporter, RND family, MFP subunit n=1 Tax=Paenibacillus curdlanolyticus YK9 TaxID=717606 RepID=E0IEH2_9BACL|nr:efflux RND transporter periplasmic adaptor subunit [Paenibacillus curdlanolyticus]EFM09060.1 efflux transporter, RND family, MFP subunit [Paenibacillus curdlanolyticus YK9]